MRRVLGTVVRGHRVASGLAEDSPYRAGTIELQVPVFRQLGVDLSKYYPATINIDVGPHRLRLRDGALTLRNVSWSNEHPPETFSFCACRLEFRETIYGATIYHPHPETKKTHFQSDNIIEVLAPWIRGVEYGANIAVVVGPEVLFE